MTKSPPYMDKMDGVAPSQSRLLLIAPPETPHHNRQTTRNKPTARTIAKTLPQLDIAQRLNPHPHPPFLHIRKGKSHTPPSVDSRHTPDGRRLSRMARRPAGLGHDCGGRS